MWHCTSLWKITRRSVGHIYLRKATQWMKHMIIPDVVVCKAGLFDYLLHLDTKSPVGRMRYKTFFLHRYVEWCSEFMSFTHPVLTLVGKSQGCSNEQMWQCLRYAKLQANIITFKWQSYWMFLMHAPNGLFGKNSFFCVKQHDFRHGLSTVAQLLHTVHLLTKILYENAVQRKRLINALKTLQYSQNL